MESETSPGVEVVGALDPSVQLQATADMEGESSQRMEMDVSVDPGLAITEDNLRRSVRGSSLAMISRSLETPFSELEIPLCRLQLMTEVRLPMDPDVERLRGEFVNGYKRGGPSFYVSTTSYNLQEMEVTDAIQQSWSPLWQEQDKIFEDRLSRVPALERFSKKMFFVWDGNHRLKAWMPYIAECHPHDVAFHVHVKAILLKVTAENHDVLLNAMTNWNK